MQHRIRLSVCAVAVLCAGLAAGAQEALDQSRRTALVTAIEKAGPAVVTINTVQIRRERLSDPFYDLFLFGPAPVREEAVEGIGSGFILDAGGHILTNYHVLQDADAISSVTLPNGRRLEVDLVGSDERSDLAVLKVRETGDAPLPFAPLGDSESLMTGEWVIAIGNPFGNMMRDPQPSVSVGVVSATHRRVSREIGQGERFYQDLIQTDAAINPGNSGGPLINALGEVVGVNTMIFSNTGGYQGLGFAIPASRVRRIVDELLTHGRRRSPWFGFRGQAVEEVSPHVLRRLDVSAESGVLVTEVFPASAADEAGLQPGDVVVRINGEAVAHPTDVDFINWGLFVGDQATFGLNRAGKALRVPLTVREYR
ncbi:MAG: trypsin-like serine protease [Candidatus Hydrogenedentes bacterium]|mgnify:CR=1 FL=1|nr:trypsin-like serine protease [Candidatus Hydrogenedentota bacterium]